MNKIRNNLPSISKKSISFKAEHEWDIYWNAKKNTGYSIYDLIAVFYRIFIIKPAVNFFLLKYFKIGGNILHAGCGSGLVDIGIENKFNLTGFDISKNALEIYKKYHSNNTKIQHGSIFQVPIDDIYYDGIFNLGVMEHFTENEIVEILKSFNLALKKGGYIILFWPPSYGIATIFLRSLHYLFTILRLDIKLHPDEITYANYSKDIESYLNNSGFNLVEFYFGFKDLFTHRIVVAVKN
jgi:2-polyprenyl-3-methyl-5-hydroxy-6-metoxy-1,4-benzoquinol methylase